MPLLKDSKALTHYGNAVKYPIAKLEKSWKAAKETLGVTGAGLLNKKAIWNGPNEIRDKWTQVKEVCPWFYKMRDMVENRFDDVGAAITNSKRDVALDAIQNGDRRRKEKEPELEKVLGNGDDDEMDDDVDEGKSTSSQPGTARRSSPQPGTARCPSP